MELAPGLAHQHRQVAEPGTVLQLDRLPSEPDRPVRAVAPQRRELGARGLRLRRQRRRREPGDPFAQSRQPELLGRRTRFRDQAQGMLAVSRAVAGEQHARVVDLRVRELAAQTHAGVRPLCVLEVSRGIVRTSCRRRQQTQVARDRADERRRPVGRHHVPIGVGREQRMELLGSRPIVEQMNDLGQHRERREEMHVARHVGEAMNTEALDQRPRELHPTRLGMRHGERAGPGMHSGVGLGERGDRLLERFAECTELAACHEQLPAMGHQDGRVLTVPPQLERLGGQARAFLHSPGRDRDAGPEHGHVPAVQRQAG